MQYLPYFKKTLLLLLVTLATMTACRKKTTGGSTTTTDKASVKFKVEEVAFEYLTSKAKISYKDEKQSFRSAVDIRMKRDSIIWISVKPALGIEAARVMLTRDSVFIMDKLNRENRAYDFATLSRMLKFEINFKMAEAAIVGNMPFELVPSKKPTKEGDFFVVQQQKENLAIVSYIKRDNHKLAKLHLTEQPANNTFVLDYDNFTSVNDKLFPYHSNGVINYTRDNKTSTTEFSIDHSKIELSDKPLRFPF